MEKFLLIPDSFKGTMSSKEVCNQMAKVLQIHYPEAQVLQIPVADGGEGSVESFLCAVGGEKKFATVKGPLFKDMQAFYGIIDNGKTAVIEMAACAGLPLMEENLNPRGSTTYGVGQLINIAIEKGCKKIILGLGGSATNDAGAGAAAAMGAQFFDLEGNEFIPVGDTLKNIAHINIAKLKEKINGIEIITMCDIDNPFFGSNGAAYIFGPQKGASSDVVVQLDQGLKHIAFVIKTDLGCDISDLKGSGAAGGMGGGMVAFFGAKLQMGIETVLDTVKFNSLLKKTSLVFTGEGKIDIQSIHGKVVCGVAKRTKLEGVPLVVIVGDIGDHIEPAYELGVSAIFSINRVAVDYNIAKTRAKSDLWLTMDNLIRFIKIIKNPLV